MQVHLCLGYMDSKRIRLRKNIEMQYLKLQLEPTNPQGGSLCGWCNLNQIRKKKTRSGWSAEIWPEGWLRVGSFRADCYTEVPEMSRMMGFDVNVILINGRQRRWQEGE
jgi:hypothetical protein